MLDEWTDLWRGDQEAITKLQEENKRLVQELEQQRVDIVDLEDAVRRDVAKEIIDGLNDYPDWAAWMQFTSSLIAQFVMGEDEDETAGDSSE